MTVVAQRPILRVQHPSGGPTRSLALGALIGVGWVVLAGLTTALALAVAAWWAADSGSFGAAVRSGAIGWLVAHGSGVHAAGANVTAIPLGGVLLAGLLLYRAARWAAATSVVETWRDAAVGVGVIAAVYTASGAAVATLTHRSSGYVDLWRAATVFAACALVFGGVGIVRGAELTDDVLDVVPDWLRGIAAGATAGFLTMTAAGAIAFAVALTVHLSTAMTIADGLDSGTIGGIILTLVGLSLVPNAAICAGAFMAGPGFAVGTGTTVSSAGVTLGPLPAFPILAATPRSGGAWWQEALVVAPLLAGAVAGIVTLRRSPTPSYLVLAARSAAAGAASGLLFGVSCLLATGAVGPGRMADIGPDVPMTTMVCCVAGLLTAPLIAVLVAWSREVADVIRRGRAAARSATARGKSR
ncbi:MAG TPA: DUF6350 family protein [Nocardioidaceae bacterium]|nr:DUF6350 family protein [Nocardioidaceae bacterium]